MRTADRRILKGCHPVAMFPDRRVSIVVSSQDSVSGLLSSPAAEPVYSGIAGDGGHQNHGGIQVQSGRC